MSDVRVRGSGRGGNKRGLIGVGNVEYKTLQNRYEGLDPHPLLWDPKLDQTSSKQFRSKEEQGVTFRSCLHPPVAAGKENKNKTKEKNATTTLQTANDNTQRDDASSIMNSEGSLGVGGGEGSFSARSSGQSSTHTGKSKNGAALLPVSLKRYHRPIKSPLPELNRATYIQYMSNTQPLLSACIAGIRRCDMSVWRDELLKRKINPHAMFRDT